MMTAQKKIDTTAAPEQTEIEEVSTNPSMEELLAKLAALEKKQAETEELLTISNKGKTLDAIKLQVEETKKADAQKAAAEKLKADIAILAKPALDITNTINVPSAISSAVISVSKDMSTYLFTKDPNRSTTWDNELTHSLNSRELKLIGDSAAADQSVIDFVKAQYGEAYNGGVERSKFNLDIFKPILDECAKIRIESSQPITLVFTFSRKEEIKDLPSGDKSVSYIPTWTFTSSLDKPAAVDTKPSNGERKKKGKSETAPGGLSWYDYLQKRKSAGDQDIIDWYTAGKNVNMDTPTNHKWYFKRYMDGKQAGAFTAWMRKDDPNWTPPENGVA